MKLPLIASKRISRHHGHSTIGLIIRDDDIASRYGDCDCDEQIPCDDYVCEECERAVIICAECHTIIDGCDCGGCPDGATFQEN